MSRSTSAEKMIARALANGATVESSTPARPSSTSAPRKGAAVGGYTNRLAAAAARGWHWIESYDSLNYRYCTVAGDSTPWGTYEDITAYAATCGPEGNHATPEAKD